MDCCECEGIERETKEWAVQDLASYRAGKPAKTTPMLVRALLSLGVRDRTLLDIGGGIGIVQIELLKAGATAATSVDASSAYLDVARQEAGRLGLEERITYLHGDFVTVASQVPSADIVTLDRVLCCYSDVKALVELSSARAKLLYGVVYPRDHLGNRIGIYFENLTYRVRRRTFRAFVHPTRLVEDLLRRNGLAPLHRQNTFLWQVAIYGRT